MITQKLTPLHTEIYKMLSQQNPGFVISLNFHLQIELHVRLHASKLEITRPKQVEFDERRFRTTWTKIRKHL